VVDLVAVTNVEELILQLRSFAEERDWDQFHDPKNLSMALVVEAGELVELFQWLTPDQSRSIMNDSKKAARVAEELADIYGYTLRLADILNISLNEALEAKIQSNGKKYPISDFKGSARKYDEDREQ
jgi:dCTP diphosphatase